MTVATSRVFVPRRTLLVWALLVGFTATTWAIGGHQFFSPTVVTALVLGIAIVKIRFIGSDFMELRSAPGALARSFDLYLAILYLALMGLYTWL
ncbi:MAG: cytochrome C oxidase subunit IV family protein [Mycobacterium kyogaense]|uniref:cytochrome C oxidase subunit IV family protein n=1 Tax=Mycobacterium kyogaense TaxID=2212479 RepID=UPI002FF83226